MQIIDLQKNAFPGFQIIRANLASLLVAKRAGQNVKSENMAHLKLAKICCDQLCGPVFQ